RTGSGTVGSEAPPGGSPKGPREPSVAGPSVRPSLTLARGVNPLADPLPPPTPSSRPGAPMPSGPDADFADRQRANKAFRDRYALSAAAQARNQPCADAVRAALEDLRRRNRYDDKAIVEVLTAVGLT